MYVPKSNRVYYVNPETGAEELFITVHQTTADVSVMAQAVLIAQMLNRAPVRQNKR